MAKYLSLCQQHCFSHTDLFTNHGAQADRRSASANPNKEIFCTLCIPIFFPVNPTHNSHASPYIPRIPALLYCCTTGGAKGIFSNSGPPGWTPHEAQNVPGQQVKISHFAGKGQVSEALAVHGIPHRDFSFHIMRKGQPGRCRLTFFIDDLSAFLKCPQGVAATFRCKHR